MTKTTIGVVNTESGCRCVIFSACIALMFFHFALKISNLSAFTLRDSDTGNSVTLLLQHSAEKVVFKVFEQCSVKLVGTVKI